MIPVHPFVPLFTPDEGRNDAQSEGNVTSLEKIVHVDGSISVMSCAKLDKLPLEITSIIYKYLKNSDKSSFSKTCKSLNSHFYKIGIIELKNKKIPKSFLSFIKLKSEFLTELCLSETSGLDDLGADAIKSELKVVKLKHLKSLKLSGNNGIFLVLELIRILNEEDSCSLNYLELSNLCLNNDNNIKNSLIQNIKSKNLSHLSTLIIKGNNLGGGFANLLVEAMILGHFSNLTHLDFSGNKLNANEMKNIFEALQICSLSQLNHLNVSRNHIVDDSIIALSN